MEEKGRIQRKENGFKEKTSSLCHMTEWPTRAKYGTEYHTVEDYTAVTK